MVGRVGGPGWRVSGGEAVAVTSLFGAARLRQRAPYSRVEVEIASPVGVRAAGQRGVWRSVLADGVSRDVPHRLVLAAGDRRGLLR